MNIIWPQLWYYNLEKRDNVMYDQIFRISNMINWFFVFTMILIWQDVCWLVWVILEIFHEIYGILK